MKRKLSSLEKQQVEKLWKYLQPATRNLAIACAIIKANVRIVFDIYEHESSNGYNCFMLAASQGLENILRAVASKYQFGKIQNIAASAAYGLHEAARHGQRSTCKLLLSLFRVQIDAGDKFGMSSFSIAAEAGHLDVCELLLSHGANVNQRDNTDRTPLFVAAKNGNHEICRFLIGAGAAVNQKKKDGCNPLYIAVQNGMFEACLVLLQAGADPTEITLNKKWSALEKAVSDSKWSILRLLLLFVESFDEQALKSKMKEELYQEAMKIWREEFPAAKLDRDATIARLRDEVARAKIEQEAQEKIKKETEERLRLEKLEAKKEKEALKRKHKKERKAAEEKEAARAREAAARLQAEEQQQRAKLQREIAEQKAREEEEEKEYALRRAQQQQQAEREERCRRARQEAAVAEQQQKEAAAALERRRASCPHHQKESQSSSSSWARVAAINAKQQALLSAEDEAFPPLSPAEAIASTALLVPEPQLQQQQTNTAIVAVADPLQTAIVSLVKLPLPPFSTMKAPQVKQWLLKLALEHPLLDTQDRQSLMKYAQIFIEHRINGEVFKTLTEEDLRKMGVKKLGHRRTILLARDAYDQGTMTQSSASSLDGGSALCPICMERKVDRALCCAEGEQGSNTTAAVCGHTFCAECLYTYPQFRVSSSQSSCQDKIRCVICGHVHPASHVKSIVVG